MRRRLLKHCRRGAILLGLIGAGAAGSLMVLRPSEAQLLQKAIRFAERGERDAAIPLFDRVLGRNPAESTALLYRGQLARDSGDTEAAVRYWNRVPDHPASEGATARFLEGSLFLEANQARRAEAAFLKAIQLNPAYLKPHERLLKLYVAQLRMPDVSRELLAVRRFRPWTLDELFQSVYLTGRMTNPEQAIPYVEKFLAADPDDLHTRVALGRYYLWDERPAEAAAVLRSARSLSPGDPCIRAYLAEALLELEDLPAARDALAGAPAGPDAEPCLWKSCGLYWMAVGEWHRAAACLGRAVLLAPQDLSAAYKLGIALERAGDAPAAKQQFQHAETLLQLHSAMFQISQWNRRRSSAVPLPTVMQAGRLLMKMNRNAESVPFFEQAVAWDPTSAAAHETLRSALQQSPMPSAQSGEAVAIDLLQPDLAIPGPEAADASRRTSDTARHFGQQQPPRIQLVDCQQQAGIEFRYFNGESGLNYVLETTGGGVAVVDYDADGWPDLFFPQGCRIPAHEADLTVTDRLFRNLGNGTFADVTGSSGVKDRQYGQGSAAGDYDNDGFPDLAVANFGTIVLHRNNGDGTFTDVTNLSGIGGDHWSTSLAWADIDRDGTLDLYVVNYVRDPLHACRSDATHVAAPCHPQFFAAEDDILYRNRGDGGFDDITRAAGILAPDGRGLGVVIADFDDDGWADIYVANDGNPSFLFRNLGATPGAVSTFAEMGLPSGTAVDAGGSAKAAMGIACADLDGDGRLDLYVTNFHREPDLLYFNRGALLFEEAALRAGLAEPTRLMLGWGTQAVDMDLDGRPELFLTNGHLEDRRQEGIPWKMPPQLFYNRGEGKFTEISRESGDFFHGEYLGRGVARLDWDRDGRPDLVVVHQDRPVALLRNETALTGRRLILDLHGVESNRDAIGARIRATAAGRTQVLEICGGDGFLATNERRPILGIGSATVVDVLEIQWPSGRNDRWTRIPVDSGLVILEGRPPQVKTIDR